MSILEQLRKAISEYRGPLPAVGDSPEELWLRQAFKQLLELETARCKRHAKAPVGGRCPSLERMATDDG
jgi:hypothetical protein